MTEKMFDCLLEERISKIRSVLKAKGREYSTAADCLHNFKRAAQCTGETPAEVCVGFFVKHLVSILDLVDALARGQAGPAREYVEEKIGDAINYLIILEAILKE